MENDLIGRFESHWACARGSTMDLLRSLGPSELAFSPGENAGSLWKQFRHLGRVQENYLHAMETGRIAFGIDGASYRAAASREELLDYLERLDEDLRDKLKSSSNRSPTIDWFGESIDVGDHLMRMADHEVLHQGMLVVYVRLLGRKFPPSWKMWGL